MTREEAKGSLIAIKNKYLANYGEDSIINILIDEYDIQAIDVAIQALEQEPCEDAISRKALISHIENQSREWGEDYDAQQILGDIEDMPSVKPQTGHWEIANSFCTCDQCGYETRPWNNTLFCPNCGARMESEKNE